MSSRRCERRCAAQGRPRQRGGAEVHTPEPRDRFRHPRGKLGKQARKLAQDHRDEEHFCNETPYGSALSSDSSPWNLGPEPRKPQRVEPPLHTAPTRIRLRPRRAELIDSSGLGRGVDEHLLKRVTQFCELRTHVRHRRSESIVGQLGTIVWQLAREGLNGSGGPRA